MSASIALWKAKLRAAQAEERQWIRARDKAVRRLRRLQREITHLEVKLGLLMENTEQGTGAADRGAGSGGAQRRTRWTQTDLDFGTTAPALYHAARDA